MGDKGYRYDDAKWKSYLQVNWKEVEHERLGSVNRPNSSDIITNSKAW
jgi:hypothetical protein